MVSQRLVRSVLAVSVAAVATESSGQPREQASLPAAVAAATASLRIPFVAVAPGEESGAQFRADGPTARVVVAESHVRYAIPVPGARGTAPAVVLRESFLGALEGTVLPGVPAPTRVSHLRGADPLAWRPDQPTWQSVRRPALYPGIDVELRMRGPEVEKVFLVQPGAQPDRIRVAVEGATTLTPLPGGELEIVTAAGTIRLTAPVAWQGEGPTRREVPIRYDIQGHTYGFALGIHDPFQALTIDPVLYATFLGGDGNEDLVDVAVGPDGNVYVTGHVLAWSMPPPTDFFPTTPGAYDSSFNGDLDVVVSKLSPDLSTLLASTYIGGAALEEGRSLDFDASGNVYVAGRTFSTDFPTTAGAYDRVRGGAQYSGMDAFVVKLNAGLTTLLASTYLGGYWYTQADALDVWSDGSVFLVGHEDGFDVSTWEAMPPGGYLRIAIAGRDVFVARLNGGLTALTGFTVFGGTGNADLGRDLVVTSTGVFVAGSTNSLDMPTTSGAYDRGYSVSPATQGGDAGDGYVAKFDLGLNTLLAATYLGGKGDDAARALAIDSRGHLFVAGGTSGSVVVSDGLPRSDFFPTTNGAYDTTYNGGWDAFVARLSADLTVLEASTVIGGSPGPSSVLYQSASSIDVDPLRGDVLIAGQTTGQMVTTARAFQEMLAGDADVFILRLDWTLSRLLASTLLGGTWSEDAAVVKLDGLGNVYFAGWTNSPEFPTSGSAYDATYHGRNHDAYVGRLPIGLAEPAIAVSVTGPESVAPGQQATFLVRYHNAFEFALTDVTIVVDVPLATDFVSATGGGEYFPAGTCNGQVYWTVGSLDPGVGGSVTFTVEVPWGTPDVSTRASARAAASNESDPLFDPSPYGVHQPPTPQSRALSSSELTAALNASPKAKSLLDYVSFLGYLDVGVAYAATDGVGSSAGDYSVLWLLDPSGSPVTMTWNTQQAVVERYGPTSYRRFDRDGGFTWDWEAGTFVPDGGLAQLAPGGTGIANGRCQFNCAISKIGPGAIKQAARLIGLKKRAADCVACATAVALGHGHLAAAQCQRCLSTLGACLQSAATRIPPVGTALALGSAVLTCLSQCGAQPQAYECSAGETHHWCCTTDLDPLSPERAADPTKICYAECDGATRMWTPATAVGMCPSGSVCRQRTPPAVPLAECTPIHTCAGPSCAVWPFRARTPRDPNAKSASPALGVLPGETITYTIEYENVGAGEAVGVFILDTLDANLDETTLGVNNGGTYSAGLRLLHWDIGTLAAAGQPGAKGSVTFTVKPRAGLATGTEIVNHAEVHFPSSFEVTPTNATVHTLRGAVADPLAITTTSATPVGFTLTGRSATGGAVTHSLVTGPTFGSLTGTLPTLVYTPQANFTGGDEFLFRVSDGVTQSDPARVSIAVAAGAADTTAPQVVAMWPSSGQTFVPFSATPVPNTTVYQPVISATFSEALDPTTVTGANVSVAGVTGLVAYDGQIGRILFTPTSALAAGTTYTATLSAAIKDASGNPLAAPYVWSFTTTPSSAPNIHISLPHEGQHLQMALGLASRRQVVAITNTGTALLTLGSLALSGPDAADFALVNNYCSAISLFPTSLCSVEVEYRPGTDGARTASLDIPSNDPETPLAHVVISSGGPSAPAPYTYYLAEGATISLFDTRLALANPGTATARGLLTFLKQGQIVSHDFEIGAKSRWTAEVKTIPGMDAAEFSTTIESDQPLAVDRTMTWDASGYGSHAEHSIPGAATVWYLAEGATHSGFDLFYLIQNPGETTAQVQVKYLLPAPAQPIVLSYAVEPKCRFNIWVDTQPGLANTDVSAVITSTTAIIVERAMYLSGGGQLFRAGHESAGITTPSTSWFFAEGNTGNFFDLFILLANPSDTDATVRATFLLPNGTTLERDYVVRANSRFNIWVDQEDPRLIDTAVSTTITSTNGVPLIGERAMWWPGPTALTWAEAHNSAGSTSTGTAWVMAEGEQGLTRQTETYLLVANTSPFAGTARVTLLFEDGTTTQREFPLLPNSRMNVAVGAEFLDAIGHRFGAIVESLGATPAQIVVERAMYSNAGGAFWAAGTNALATKLR